MQAHEAGIAIGTRTAGTHNAITDVAGVRVGHWTRIEGKGPLDRGAGPVRTGVTVIDPSPHDVWTAPGPDPGSWTRGIQQLLEEAR